MQAKERRGKGAGFTLLELMIAIAVLAIAIGGISRSLAATSTLSRATEERGIAIDAALSVMESLRAETAGEVYVRYNEPTLDDPAVGFSPGRFFAVPSLTLRLGDADGFAGEIIFPGDGAQLLENGDDDELGLPRDLDADGVVDALDHSLNYTILPVRIRVEWRGVRGFQRVELYTQVGIL
jgi:prepilin-type N-terminal cleavage/methylation domain-containing protein